MKGQQIFLLHPAPEKMEDLKATWTTCHKTLSSLLSRNLYVGCGMCQVSIQMGFCLASMRKNHGGLRMWRLYRLGNKKSRMRALSVCPSDYHLNGPEQNKKVDFDFLGFVPSELSSSSRNSSPIWERERRQRGEKEKQKANWGKTWVRGIN